MTDIVDRSVKNVFAFSQGSIVQRERIQCGTGVVLAATCMKVNRFFTSKACFNSQLESDTALHH